MFCCLLYCCTFDYWFCSGWMSGWGCFDLGCCVSVCVVYDGWLLRVVFIVCLMGVAGFD